MTAMKPPLRSRFHVSWATALAALLAFACSTAPAFGQAGAPACFSGEKPCRGAAVLSSSIGTSLSPEEIETFCKECGVSLVVVDFAWITPTGAGPT